jgi:hypothetical protein
LFLAVSLSLICSDMCSDQKTIIFMNCLHSEETGNSDVLSWIRPYPIPSKNSASVEYGRTTLHVHWYSVLYTPPKEVSNWYSVLYTPPKRCQYGFKAYTVGAIRRRFVRQHSWPLIFDAFYSVVLSLKVKMKCKTKIRTSLRTVSLTGGARQESLVGCAKLNRLPPWIFIMLVVITIIIWMNGPIVGW